MKTELNKAKEKIDMLIIVDWADTSQGCVIFSIDNQPILVRAENVRGLNWSYRPDAEIINEAINQIERKENG